VVLAILDCPGYNGAEIILTTFASVNLKFYVDPGSVLTKASIKDSLFEHVYVPDE